MSKLICLDAGHGFDTAGNRTPNIEGLGGRSIQEFEFNKKVVKFLESELIRCGFDVVIVSDENIDIPLYARVYKANSLNADLYVSIHYNAYDGTFEAPNPEGLSVHIYPNSVEGRIVAECVLKYLQNGTYQVNRGIQENNFYVLRETKCPAILTENGFMDNLKEAMLMIQEDFQREVAKEHCQGICEYFGVQYVEETLQDKLSNDKQLLEQKLARIKELLEELKNEVDR